jgi:ABC-type glycerol-3-phosphate transport system substrate-binding protein
MRKVVMVLALLFGAAACSGTTPTDGGAATQAASFDGGTLAGSGNRTDSAGVQTTSADSAGRGGTLAGSGN